MLRLWGERSHSWRAGLYATVFVLAVAAGDLTLYPLIAVRLGTVLPVVVAVAAVWSARTTRWRHAAPISVLALTGVVAGTSILALDRAPDPLEGRLEVQGLLAGLAIAVAGVALSRGSRRGLVALRRGWALALLLSVLVGAIELATRRHLWIEPGMAWAEHSRTIIAGAFRNPNDFALALTAMISGTLAHAADLRARTVTSEATGATTPANTRRRRGGVSRPSVPTSGRDRGLLLGLAVLVVLGVVGVALTESRSGMLALLLVLTIHAVGAVRRHVLASTALVSTDLGSAALASPTLASPTLESSVRASTGRASSGDASSGNVPSGEASSGVSSTRASARGSSVDPTGRRVRLGRTAIAGMVATILVAGVAAAFLVPALAARNPILHMALAAGEPGTARSDRLRLDLIRAALRYVGRSDGWGTGAASYEVLLARDPAPGVATRTWLHNTFVELLLQYGVVAAAALAGVLVVVAVAVVRPRRRGPAVTLARVEILGAIVPFVALGCASATVLATPIWWLLLGQAVATAWWLTTSPDETRRDDDRDHHDDDVTTRRSENRDGPAARVHTLPSERAHDHDADDAHDDYDAITRSPVESPLL